MVGAGVLAKPNFELAKFSVHLTFSVKHSAELLASKILLAILVHGLVCRAISGHTGTLRPIQLDYMFLVNQFLKSSEGIWSTFIFKFSTFLRVDTWIDFQTEAPAQAQA
jgi:hypothetical protein